jgi:predicted transcriptional regulator of viral defense system
MPAVSCAVGALGQGAPIVMLMFAKVGQSHDMVDHTRLYRVAEAQAGFFTARQAADAGMARSTLSHHAARDGRYERVAQGVYRLRQFPSSPHEHVVATWLSLGGNDAVVSHASALELHDLSDVIADEVHLTVPRSARWRRRRPGTHLHFASQPVAAGERQRVLGLPVTTVERTIADYVQDAGQPEQAEMAVAQAIAKGLTTAPRLRAAAAGRSARVRDQIERAIEQSR